MNRLIAYFIHQNTLVNIITLLVIVGGVYAALGLQREFFPNIDFDVVVVSTTYPGASSETVETLVTNSLERELLEVEGVKKLTSVSTEGLSILRLQLDSDVTSATEAKSATQDAVDAWNKLPSGANKPVVIVPDTSFFPVITISLSGDVDESVLKQAAESLEKPIESLSDVAKVGFVGMRDYEIFVEASKKQLEKWDVSLIELVRALRANNVNIPAGTHWQAEKKREVIIRTVAELRDVEDIQNTVVRANAFGRPVYVKDVAQVRRDFEKRATMLRVDGMPSYQVVVYKKEQGDIIDLVKEVKAMMASSPKVSLPEGVSYDFIDDRSYFVKRRLSVLSNNLIIGLILVVLILSIALPIRVALITAFGIPFALLVALICMYFLGVSVNIVSMLGLILVIGMLVDDAIVVTENIQRNMEQGLSPREASIKGTGEIWPPLLTSVSTTMIAFAPLLFFGGVTGKFIQYIPIGVLLGLGASLFECFFILPNHMAHWVREKKKAALEGAKKQASFWRRVVLKVYGIVVRGMIRFRYLVVPLLLAGLFVTVISNASFLRQFKMFPGGTVAQFSIQLQGTVGQSLDTTLDMVKRIENAAAGLSSEEMLNYRTTVGRLSEGRNRGATGQQYAQVEVYLTEPTERERDAGSIIAELKQKIGKIEGAKYNFRRARSGPPVGKPVSIGVRGDSYEEIMAAVDKIKELLLTTQEGVSDVVDSFRPGKEEIHVDVDPKLASAAGLSLSDIGQTVRASYAGIVAASIEMLSEEIDIRVRLTEKERDPSKSLTALTIPNARGQKIPISKVASFREQTSVAAYEHENNERQVIVSAEIDMSKNSPIAVSASMRSLMDDIKAQHPTLTFFFGGENQDTRENIGRLITIALSAFFGIFLLLILLFKNIIQPILISMTIPMAIIPIIWVFYAHGQPLSFLALVGMVALAGVIVNHSIVFTDFVNRLREEGESKKSSIVEAAKIRLRPIFLATITTVCGIMPTAYGIGGLDPFVVPLALALGWGLGVGSFLVSLFYPPLLAIADDLTWLLRWIMNLPKHLLARLDIS